MIPLNTLIKSYNCQFLRLRESQSFSLFGTNGHLKFKQYLRMHQMAYQLKCDIYDFNLHQHWYFVVFCLTTLLQNYDSHGREIYCHFWRLYLLALIIIICCSTKNTKKPDKMLKICDSIQKRLACNHPKIPKVTAYLCLSPDEHYMDMCAWTVLIIYGFDLKPLVAV